MDANAYQNPLSQTVLKGALRVLKRLAVDAGDEVLAGLVSQIEAHYQKQQGETNEGQRNQ